MLNLKKKKKKHFTYVENKCSENIGLLYKEKHHLNKKCVLPLYYSYVHTYINYANIAWGSTLFTNLEKIHNWQKHTIRIVRKLVHTRHLFRLSKILNVYQINILNSEFNHFLPVHNLEQQI